MDKSVDDLAQWMINHDNFHNFIKSLSGRSLLMRQTERIRMMLLPYFRRHHVETHELEIPGHEHQKIIDALRGKDPDVIEQTVRAHAMANVKKVARLT